MGERIVSDPEVCSGKPVIRGTRIMVRQILGLLGAGEAVEAILASYPSLTPEDVEAVRLAPRLGAGRCVRPRRTRRV